MPINVLLIRRPGRQVPRRAAGRQSLGAAGAAGHPGPGQGALLCDVDVAPSVSLFIVINLYLFIACCYVLFLFTAYCDVLL